MKSNIDQTERSMSDILPFDKLRKNIMTAKEILNEQIHETHINEDAIIHIRPSTIIAMMEKYAKQPRRKVSERIRITDLNINNEIQKVCDFKKVKVDYIFSVSRKQDIVHARDIIFYYLRQQKLSYNRIAGHFQKNHATVIHGVRFAEKNLMADYKTIFG